MKKRYAIMATIAALVGAVAIHVNMLAGFPWSEHLFG